MNDHIDELIQLAIADDLPDGIDITTESTISADQMSVGLFTTRKPGTISGVEVAIRVLQKFGIEEVITLVNDGEQVQAGSVIIKAKGSTRQLLIAERTALNFLTHLSGIATLTRSWVDAVSGTGCLIRDTRKTTPGYRYLEKKAVRDGGGTNHRMSLSDAALIKDNHIQAAGGVVTAIAKVRAANPQAFIEIEVDTLDQLKDVLPTAPNLILLDNMTVEQCKEAVRIVAGATELEASGGINLDNVKDYANSGVDYVAIGALTHSAPVLDIGLDFVSDWNGAE